MTRLDVTGRVTVIVSVRSPVEYTDWKNRGKWKNVPPVPDFVPGTPTQSCSHRAACKKLQPTSLQGCFDCAGRPFGPPCFAQHDKDTGN
jgi:hypothetical protein